MNEETDKFAKIMARMRKEPERRICPYCEEAGEKSRLTESLTGTSTMEWTGNPAFYDEDGIYHYHREKKNVKEYTCSNRHRFAYVSKTPCPNCDYNSDFEQTIRSQI